MHPAAGLRRFTALSMIWLLAFAGCSSDRGPGDRRGGPGGPRGQAPTPMAGQDNFFDGQILAEITVGTEGMPEPGAGAGGGERGDGGRGRRGGGGGGGLSIAGAGGLVGGNVSGGVPFGGGGRPRRDSGGPGGEPAGPRPMMAGAMGRPVMIHLRFTNQGPAAVTLWIDDFVSPLGNFAVRPEKLVLAPGQALETEPMTSQLAGAFAETDATLALRLGPSAEKKTFRLKAVPGSKEPEPKPEK
ncbi:MAG: hypothetical protein PSV13_05720 [Lacunisphaera sp.]|nr:hypothetical protein [Lacunisphaera sp.]